jgi:hypothetical protein
MFRIWLIDICADEARWQLYIVLFLLSRLCSPKRCHRQGHPSTRVVDLPEGKRIDLFLNAVRIFQISDHLSHGAINIRLTCLSLFDLLLDLF